MEVVLGQTLGASSVRTVIPKTRCCSRYISRVLRMSSQRMQSIFHRKIPKIPSAYRGCNYYCPLFLPLVASVSSVHARVRGQPSSGSTGSSVSPEGSAAAPCWGRDRDRDRDGTGTGTHLAELLLCQSCSHRRDRKDPGKPSTTRSGSSQ